MFYLSTYLLNDCVNVYCAVFMTVVIAIVYPFQYGICFVFVYFL